MSLSTDKFQMRQMPMQHAGHPRAKCSLHSGLHRVRASVRALRSESLTVSSSQVLCTVSPKWPKIVFDPLKCRKTVGRVSAPGVRCAAFAETQTIERKSSSATILSPPGKETLPMLDDGGSGFRGYGYTPYYRGDGSGGGSGGGGGLPGSGGFPWGDYWFYIFLFLLRFLMMNIIGEGTCVYKYEDGRNKPIRRYV